MKNLIFLSVITCLSLGSALGQSKPKTKKEERAPTQKEMEAMMKEAQREMDNLDPETKKMMDSMGIAMPSFKEIPQVTDEQLKKAYEDENRIVPLRDASRIASIPKATLTNATLPAFISATHSKTILQLKPASKTKGEEIYRMIKTQYNSPVATGNTAASLWMIGKAELALYVMGKACIDGPTNADNLNNYASMLSMSGAEQLSIPLLVHINKRHPRNSTILNNLGQAWFGLGDIDKASVYLDSVIRMYAYHPQANFTKSFIEESKGNKTAAVEAAKRSIRNAYTDKKAERLNKLGHKVKPAELRWDRPMPADALGLEKFKRPAYPMSVAESEPLEKEWQLFKARCQQEMATLEQQQTSLEKTMLAENQKRMQLLLTAGQKGVMVDPLPATATKAFIKLKYLIEGKDGQLTNAYKNKGEAVAKALLDVAQLEEKLDNQMEEIQKKYEDLFGEGKPNPFDAACKDENGVKDAFLVAANGNLEKTTTDFLNFMRKMINDETYYNQYTMWPDQFEYAKVHAKMKWLSLLTSTSPKFKNRSAYCQDKVVVKAKPFKLSAFDDVHCMYHSQLTTPVGTIRTDCSRMTTTLDLKFIKLGLKQDMDRETFGDQFMTCSVEVGAGVGAGVNTGPLKAEASVGGAIAAEFDRNGLKDLVIKTSAGVSAGTDIISGGSAAGVGVSDLSVEVGVQGQVSLISGKSSAESTGLLAGAFQK